MRNVRLCVLFLASAGCHGGQEEDTAVGWWSTAGWTAEWSPCSLYEGEDDGRAECATMDLPLFWDDDSDPRTIQIWAKRLLSGGAPADVQLWLLDGGPGASGMYDFPPYMEYFQSIYPGVDVYTLDHRGTGYSERLTCPAEGADSESAESITSDELPDCTVAMQEALGDRLLAYTSTFSSMDLAAYIDASREAGKRVIVRGTSYGSYWAQRYLAVAPTQADGVIIEGIFPADGTMIVSEQSADLAGQELFQACAQDETCVAHLGADPWAYLGDVLGRMDSQGHCTRVGLTRELVSAMFAYLMYSRGGMSTLPAATYRLERCDAADEAALVNLYYALFGDGGAWDIAAYSVLLQHHVSYSEMWQHPDFEGVDLDAWYDALYADALVVKGYGHTKAEYASYWPTYADPDYDDVWPQTQVPMLMLQGELDPACGYGEALRAGDAFTADNQHFYSFPWSGHSVSFDTPVDEDGSTLDCGMQMLLGFLADPSAEPDDACLGELLPVSFDLGPEYAAYYFGTSDYWD